MNIKYRNSMILAVLVMTFAFLTTSAQAQWRMTSNRTDAAGRLTEFHEKNARGDVRSTTWTYFPNSVVRLHRVTTRSVAGLTTVLVEQRDGQNRVIATSSTRINAGGALVFGARQTIRYQGPRDRRGSAVSEEYDPRSDSWRRI